MYTTIDNCISEAECKDLIAFVENPINSEICHHHPGTYITNHAIVDGEFTSDEFEHSDDKVFKATFITLPPEHPIKDKLWIIGSDFAEQYNYNINSMHYPAILKYQEGSHFAWHTDGFNETDKLTIGVQLSSPEDYEGADFQFGKDTSGETRTTSEDIYKDWELTQKSVTPIDTWSKDIGSLIIYDSFLYHRVTPLTKGRRYVLLTWLRFYED